MPVALVTGAYRGLGLEWCRQLGRDRYTVLLTARSQTKADAAAASLVAEGLDVVPEVLDVGDEDSIRVLAARVAERFGAIDLVVNNAGINAKDHPDADVRAQNARLDQLDADQVLRHLHINSVAPVLVVKHLRPLLARADRPVVVSISSWLGSLSIKTTNRANYSYSVSKAALNMMNRAMAIELKPEGIVAVVVNPGWVVTEMGGPNASLTPEQSVRGVLDNVVATVTLDDSGGFFQWDGSVHPW